ncbi:serine/threonine-protein kinase Nek4 isoform X2 [Brienomyrus brachyistius]|uniref:serine/threonine-protein kinase Nek4 isoform X2 n=1 Tax=Brienomyrus brachyistius TaxID=42636 RepID=UPI0020B1B300|nr:serine/threonine-protein kinase Nek4 isoform X2 [Brienomyrus brachyistius]
MESYTFVRVVGKGSYGEVNLVRHRTEGKQYVIKKLNLRMSSKRERRSAEQEAQLLSQLRHPNIVTYRESWEGEDCHLYIVMGYCEGGDLYHRLKQQKGELLLERQVVEWFVQIAMALQYLHEKHILHRDLKTQNIFLTKTNIIKVGDLGIARVLENQNDMASTLIGTPYYMSPELFSNKPYNYKSDIWALGCCVYEMATLKHAFNAKDMNSLVYRIVEGKLPQMPSKYDLQLGELIRSMLSKKPEERPDVKHILRQPYIKQQIALFLEATKEKTAKSKKKVVSRQPNSASSLLVPSLSKPEAHNQPLSDISKKGKAREVNYLPQHKSSSPANEALPTPKEYSPEALPQDSLNNTGASLATVSNIDIDILSSKENRDHLKAQPPTLIRPNHIHSDAKPVEEKKSRKTQPSSSETHNTKIVCSDSRTNEEPKDPLVRDAVLQPGNLVKSGPSASPKLQNEDTLKLLQEAPASEDIQVKEILDSTEKLLEPLVSIIIEEYSAHESLPSLPSPKLQPPSSTSEPSVSCLHRQRNREKMWENRGNDNEDMMALHRPLPPSPGGLVADNVKRSQSSMEAQTSSSSGVPGSRHLGVAVSHDRPLSARERRRLKQSQEDFCHLAGVPAPRPTSCDIPCSDIRPSHVQKAAVNCTASDTPSKTNKVSRLSQQQSEEDDCSSSTSSTDPSEGEHKEGKSQSNEIQDLVQLMTQTLRMDSRDPGTEKSGCVSTSVSEFKLNRKYRDTLVLHGKAKLDEVDFHLSELPSDTTSGRTKIMRAIERLRTDVAKGLGVKLLNRVLDIMEEDDEGKRELCLREEMGEDTYKAYAVMVRQLKFFEDVVSREWGNQ